VVLCTHRTCCVVYIWYGAMGIMQSLYQNRCIRGIVWCVHICIVLYIRCMVYMLCCTLGVGVCVVLYTKCRCMCCVVHHMCTHHACDGVYMWCCVHVVRVVLCIHCASGTMYMLYCVHIVHVVLCIFGMVLWVLCSHCIKTGVFVVLCGVYIYVLCCT